MDKILRLVALLYVLLIAFVMYAEVDAMLKLLAPGGERGGA